MKKEVFIGIDAGSTHLKTALYSCEGTLIDIRRCRVHVYQETPEGASYDAEEIFSQLCQCLRDLLRPDLIPAAVGISSFGESIVPIDSSGKALTKMIAWYDMRAQRQIHDFACRFGYDRLYSITGQSPSGKFTLAKLLWMKEHTPELFSRVRCFLFMQDYLSYKLTGNLCTEYSLASRSMLFDIAKKNWSREILSESSLSDDYLPQVIPSGSIVGQVSEAASRLIGIPAGIPVVLAGHDHASASISAAIHSPGTAMDSLGTSETSLFSSIPAGDQRISDCHLSFYPYSQDRYCFISSIQGCGFSIEWIARLLFEDDIYNQFFRHAKEGCESCPRELPLFLPYLRGLQECPGATGSFVGIRDIHGKAALCASVLEGLCFEHKRRLLQGEHYLGTPFSAVRVSGRLSQYPVFMQLKANVLQKEVQVLSQPEAVSLGAAILAGRACGCLSHWTPALSAVYKPEPDTSVYQSRYSHYTQAVDSLLRKQGSS